jgi:hypothetical protein
MASSSAADAAASSNPDSHWLEKPSARQLVSSAMREVAENCKMDLLPTVDDARLLGLYSKDPTIEAARYGCVVERVMGHGGPIDGLG